MSEQISVSIMCITYNQSDYIAEAIESFLMQKTDFKYEIIIHDDASTDGTAEIVKKYAFNYPDKIITILQNENQYSKHVKISQEYIYPITRGKYLAFCEGDDFWTDEYKLQKQYDYMEAHPDCSLCMHDGWIISEDKKITFNSKPQAKVPTIYGIEDAINGLGVQVVTNSFFYRASVLKSDMPEFVTIAPTGDYPKAILSALYGYIYYMPEKMSAHRMLAKNSYSKTMGSGSQSQGKWKIYLERQKAMMKEMDRYTNFKYHAVISEAYVNQCFDIYFLSRNKNMLRKEPYKSKMQKCGIRKKLELYYPRFFSLLQAVHYSYLRVFPIRKL